MSIKINKKPSFKVFNRMLKIKNLKLEKKVNLFNRIIKYIRFRMEITFLKVLTILFMVVISGTVSRIAEEKRVNTKYRKVIKKGILWDTVEYHER